MRDQNREMDVESLQKTDSRRGSCLHVFLVVSIVFLFVAVAGLAAGGVMFALDVRSKLKPFEVLPPTAERLTGPAPYPEYKMQKFAFLEAKSVELKNSTMHWHPVHYGAAVSVGTNFLFDPAQQSLKPHQEGTYFMYMELNVTCTFNCSPGLLSVSVGDKLTCNLRLPATTNSAPVSKKCWAVSQMNGKKLVMQMTVHGEAMRYWRLESTGSGFGMFLVD
ncbi:uncharacterized protein LOC131467204 [Solea solea]|uniref:uncharacterized protein LOC131467204 n=1 Tax=Solea solea TaxID=90069 RepID=UPI00272D7775|nr:uncharacterized protein LOC131467204 [Solea solea]